MNILYMVTGLVLVCYNQGLGAIHCTIYSLNLQAPQQALLCDLWPSLSAKSKRSCNNCARGRGRGDGDSGYHMQWMSYMYVVYTISACADFPFLVTQSPVIETDHISRRVTGTFISMEQIQDRKEGCKAVCVCVCGDIYSLFHQCR